MWCGTLIQTSAPGGHPKSTKPLWMPPSIAGRWKSGRPSRPSGSASCARCRLVLLKSRVRFLRRCSGSAVISAHSPPHSVSPLGLRRVRLRLEAQGLLRTAGPREGGRASGRVAEHQQAGERLSPELLPKVHIVRVTACLVLPLIVARGGSTDVDPRSGVLWVQLLDSVHYVDTYGRIAIPLASLRDRPNGWQHTFDIEDTPYHLRNKVTLAFYWASSCCPKSSG